MGACGRAVKWFAVATQDCLTQEIFIFDACTTQARNGCPPVEKEGLQIRGDPVPVVSDGVKLADSVECELNRRSTMDEQEWRDISRSRCEERRHLGLLRMDR